MKPTPDDLAKGIRALLREVAPQITLPQGTRHLRRAMATLRDARWSEAGFDLLANNAVLADALDAVRVTPGATAAIAGLCAEIDALVADRTAPVSFATANDRNQSLRNLLCRSLEALGTDNLVGSAPLRRHITAGLLRERRA